MPAGEAPERPPEMTVVVYGTWIVAALTAFGGLVMLFTGQLTLAEAGVAFATAERLGVIEIGLAVVIAGVARTLGEPNRAARWMVMFLMAVRIAWSIWAGRTFFGTTMFWSAALAAVIALVVIVLLWGGSVKEYYAKAAA